MITLAILVAGCSGPGPLPGLNRNPASTLATLTATASASPTASARPTATASASPTTTPRAALEAGATTPAPVAGGAPCTIVVRPPPLDAPTASANGTPLPRQVDPHVEICASAIRLHIGDALTLLAQPVDIGLPDYYVSASDNGSAGLRQMVEVTYDNRLTRAFVASQILEFVSAQPSMRQLAISLRARAAGTTEFVVAASGEVHYGYPGPATWSGGQSQPITITVTT